MHSFQNKNNVFKKLGISLPEELPAHYTFEHSDFFNDKSTLHIEVCDTKIVGTLTLHGLEEHKKIDLRLRNTGRTYVFQSQGFEPNVRTVDRAIEVLQELMKKHSPVVEKSNKLIIKKTSNKI